MTTVPPTPRDCAPAFFGKALLLPVADGADWPCAPSLRLGETVLLRKPEFHVTLLNQELGAALRTRLDEAHLLALASTFDWRFRRCAEATVLRKIKLDGANPLPCASLIEHIELPAFSTFRAALAKASGLTIPDAPPHVTLYVAGDPTGIGVPDLHALTQLRQFDLHLPGAAVQPPPALAAELLAAYLAANYVVRALGLTLRIDAPSPMFDVELERRGAQRAIVISACNPFSVPQPEAANALRQQLLQFELGQAGLATLDSENRDPSGQWPAEHSLLAFDTTPDFDDRLLKRFEQHALVTIERGEPARLVLHPSRRPA